MMPLSQAVGPTGTTTGEGAQDLGPAGAMVQGLGAHQLGLEGDLASVLG